MINHKWWANEKWEEFWSEHKDMESNEGKDFGIGEEKILKCM